MVKKKEISGRWDGQSRNWIFPIEALEQVKHIYLDVYGEWEDMPLETVNVICKSGVCGEYNGSLVLHGRIIATAQGRDSGAKTAQGIIVLSGGFTSGGSVKNWKTVCKDETTFKILNVPKEKALQMVNMPDWCDSCEIEESICINKEELTKEKERLLKRIEEIDNILKGL
jgi:hypothetical protein